MIDTAPPVTLTTERLVLEPLSHDHAAAMHRLSVDVDVRRYLFDGRIIPMSQVETMIEQSHRCFEDTGSGFFALGLASDPDRFVGFCGHRVFENGTDMELLVGVDPSIWGAGIGVEAARAVLAHGFEQCEMTRVVAATDTPNQRSVRLLQKLGMSFRERRPWHGLDTMFYDLTREEFSGS